MLERFSKNSIVRTQKHFACVAQLRPIENFWYQLRQKVYKCDWKAQNINELED